MADPDLSAVDPAEPAREVAGYRIEHTLGKGGLGTVYAARDASGRRLALKLFGLQGDDDGVIEQAFLREARVGQRLAHPGIVAMLGFGRAGEFAYMAMEFVEGGDLSVHTAGGRRLDETTACRITARVARALAYAHGLGVLHRDIKPGNILLHPPSDTVKLTDFGLARLGDMFRSRTGLIAGTPSYMSPEQLSEGRLDARSDLYSLGVVLFELLAARLPYEAASMGELLRRRASEAAPDIRTFRPEASEALAQLLSRLLQPSPAARPPDAAALADELDAITPGPKSRP